MARWFVYLAFAIASAFASTVSPAAPAQGDSSSYRPSVSTIRITEPGEARRIVQQLATTADESRTWLAIEHPGISDFKAFVSGVVFEDDGFTLELSGQYSDRKVPPVHFKYESLDSIEVYEESMMWVSWFGVKLSPGFVLWHRPNVKSDSDSRNTANLLADAIFFLREERQDKVFNAAIRADLKTMNATYRVSDSDAVIRRKPDTKGAVVRKLPTGSIVQVTGQLPTGWLQVAREGEAIGWVHSSSVSLQENQTAPALAPVASTSSQSPTQQPATSVDPAMIDIAFWDSMKTSTNPSDFQAYLQKFPNGIFASLARSRLVALAEPVPAYSKPIAQPANGKFNFGNYYALVIGNNNYRSVTPLKTAAIDAKEVAEELSKNYGFKVTLLLDATRSQMLDAFDDVRRTLTENDNLLIYYAGHGYLDPDSDRGFWIPVDADANRRANWLSNSDLTDTVRATRAKHVLVIADSCYAGTLTRSLSVQMSELSDFSRLAQKRARTALTSGGLEPVQDSGGGQHSIFAKAFLGALRSNTGIVEMSQIFSLMRREVILGSQQTPQYGDIRQTGHEGGDFIFVRRK